jgi:hypothetical protein
MKKLLLLFVLIGFTGFSQNKPAKPCDCCPDKVVKRTPVKKKAIKKRTYYVTKPAPKVEPCTVVVNNIIPTPPPIIHRDTVIIQKETIVKIVEKQIPPPRVKGPEFEIYVGAVNPKEQGRDAGPIIGFNLLPYLFQSDKNEAIVYRPWLNRFLIGFEFSMYGSPTNKFTVQNNELIPLSTSANSENCNCGGTDFNGLSSSGEITTFAGLSSPSGVFTHSIKTMGASLNFGVEVYKGYYLLGGITGYRDRIMLNDQEIGIYREMYLDAGIKKIFKINKVYLSPTVKFNSRGTSMAVGFSFD